MLFCPIYNDSICSLCCTLDACCHDACKISLNVDPIPTILEPVSVSPKRLLQGKLSPQLGTKLLKYASVFLSLSGLAGATLGFVYHQQVVAIPHLPSVIAKQLTATLLGAYGIFLVMIGIGSWWLVLTQESRQLAQEELDKRNLQLQQEVKERQLAEAQLQEKAQQLEQTLRDLKQAETQLIQTEKMAALGGLVAGIAHEINTPIGIGVTAASLLVEKTTAFSERLETGTLKRSELGTFLDIAQQTARMTLTNLNRAAELIASFKRVAVDQSSESRRVFHLAAYLDEVLLQLSPKLQATQLQVRVKGDRTLTLNSYPGAFSQIVTNLLINSVLHAYGAEALGHITLSFSQTPEVLCLKYLDDGCGIPPEHLSKIFETFFTTKRGQGGSGLGLHIVYNLVTQKLGGTIRCESQVGTGTKFVIELPVVQG
jgi:signal transduction histidine kinase